MFQANLITDYPPDSIEWCPIHKDIFACGTYLYNPENTTRDGSIYLFKYNSSTKIIDTIQHQTTNGILDLKWIQYSPELIFLSTISALGQLSLYSLNDFTKPI